AKTCTVEVINGTGSGEYIAGEKINIMAEPKTGMVFTGWKAESVYYTTEQKEETILDADGNEQTITVYVRERHAEPVADTVFGSTSIPITTLTVPELEDGNILEVTAECLDAVTAVDFKMTLPKGGETMPAEMTTNSDGVSIVPDSFKVTPADTTAKYNTTYTMSVDITINEGYALGENAVFNVNGGVAAVSKNDNGSYTVTYIYKTGKDSVISVTQPDALTNLPNGISMGDIISSLPDTLTVTTEGGTVTDVPVVWESNPVEGSYSAERDIAQTFKLRAILQLPENISNPQELYGDVQISVNGETPYSVTVNDGSGSGNYKKGSVVPVSLTDIPNDKVFTNWNVDEGNVTLNNSAARSTFFTMPAENVVISAAYRDKIKNVELTVNEPTAVENLPTEVTCETEGVTASLVWTPNDTVAGYNKSYTASIRLKADSANFYEFADSVSAYVNGNNADVAVNEDKTITVTYDFTTAKAKLTEIFPSKLTGIKNGTALADMPLPDRVNVVTEDSDITSAEVEWDMSSAAYDSTDTGEQSFTIIGAITSDNIDISEYNGVPTLNVTVSAADKAAAPIAEPIEGIYTENQAVTLTTATEDAKILYSINGGEFTEYTVPIEVNGTTGETVRTVIKAKTVKAGLNESEVAEYTYTIKLPEPTYTLTVVNGSGSGEYKAGEEVTIMADAAKENTTFAGWEVSDGTALAAEEKITFAMPSYPVTVTAKYRDKITRLNLTITEPKAGETLDDTISCGDTTGISEAIMAWFTEDITAQYDTEYWMLAAVVPDSDNFYEFADNAVVAIN
ncbi:MAG: chitobiase/beta-hexosaminidase C-terminal domain-containing protein, partial [Hominilimicola sp.]